MNNESRYLLGLIVLLLLIVLVAATVSFGQRAATEETSFSQLLKDVDAGRVQHVSDSGPSNPRAPSVLTKWWRTIGREATRPWDNFPSSWSFHILTLRGLNGSVRRKSHMVHQSSRRPCGLSDKKSGPSSVKNLRSAFKFVQHFP
jgi:hypothetical protein